MNSVTLLYHLSYTYSLFALDIFGYPKIFLDVFALHQKHGDMKMRESLRKQMNSMVVGQFLSISKAIGSITSTGKN
jgi:hypothetical protein